MADKIHMNLVTVGHVDHGKSTTVGRLLYDTGNVSEEQMRKLEEKAKELKKDTFAFAYVMDSLKEEQQRGVTIDVAHKRFDTDKYYFTVIDAPGHRDFVKNMITGASQADAAIVVCSAKDGPQAQTKEHIFLCKILGVDQVIISLNKMDEVNYDEAKYNEAKESVSKILTSIGYDPSKIPFVPASAFQGDNIAKKSENMSWYSGPTIVEALDQLEAPQQPTDKPLRMPIQDVYSITGIGTVPVGRVETGILKKGSKVVFAPGGAEGEVKSIEMHHEDVVEAPAGSNVGVSVRGVDKNAIKRGDVMCEAGSAAQPVKSFKAQIIVLNHPNVITKGYTPVFHCHTAQVACRVEAIEKKINPKTGETVEENPDFIKTGDAAIVKVVPTKPLILEDNKTFPELARFAIRDMGQTVAAGVCLETEK